jgi:Tfp pilus assembly protein PilE
VKNQVFQIVKYILFIAVFVLTIILFYQSLFQVKTAANDVMAKSILRKISDSLESYKAENKQYPASVKGLTSPEYPYLLDGYFQGVHYGFRFTYEISRNQYTVTATPVSESSHTVTYMITTGGKFQQKKSL